MRRVYYYSHPFGVEMRGVVHETREIVIVANKGIYGVIVPRSHLDVIGGKYFTTPRRAIESDITVSEAVIADPTTDKGHLGGLHCGLMKARARLKELP